MLELIAGLLIASPAALIGSRAQNGRGAGWFVLYAWLAGAASYGFFGLAGFAACVAGLAAAGFTWRQRLQFGRWLSGRSGD
ncbi:hypothetical protein ACHMW6_21195 [Pseudoduganella sp. UC29_106]|uniref:hypothetical protein n=1 Tax=Pseudoduganella sp. UC29_106 TaxID=3374553 RepID=UPI003757D1B4